MQRTRFTKARWMGYAPLLGMAAGLVLAACGQDVVDTRSDPQDNGPAPPPVVRPVIPGPTEHDLINVDPSCPPALSPCREINGAAWQFPAPANVGTGNINPFWDAQNSPSEACFNTDASTFPPVGFDCHRASFTDKLPLNQVPVFKENNTFYRELIFDANEENNATQAQFSIDRFDLWACEDPDAPTYDEVDDFRLNPLCAKVYDIVEGIKTRALAADNLTSGSGKTLDYRILIPEAAFQAVAGEVDVAGCPYNPLAADCGIYLVLHAEMGGKGGDFITGATFEEISTVKRGFVTVSKTTNESFRRTFDWTIAKSVNPATHNFFVGGPGANSSYTVTVTKGTGVDDQFAVSGNIVITNPSGQDVVINAVTDDISGVGAAPVVCPGGLPQTLGKSATLTCTYSSPLPDNATRLNTASVELEDGAVSQGTASIDFTGVAPTTTVLNSVTVQDVFPHPGGATLALGTVSATTTFASYTRAFSCTGSETEATANNYSYTRTNRASIVETGQFADRTVTVNCWRVNVTKTAVTSLTRTYSWSILKTVLEPPPGSGLYSGTANIELALGQVYFQAYKVLVTNTGSTDSQWKVQGVITITNPAPIPLPAAAITSVTDVINPGGIPAAVGTCSPGDIAASGGTKTCPYGPTALPDGTDRTNTASVTVYGQVRTDDAAVDFPPAPANITHRDNCIVVKDAGDLGNTDPLGTVCVPPPPAQPGGAFTAPHTFSYFAPNAVPTNVCGDRTYRNTATGTTNTTSTVHTSSAVLNVTIACPSCTLTLGYWKTHNVSFRGGAPPDDNWLNITPFAELSGFFTTANSYPIPGPNNIAAPFTWFSVFWTAPRGNAYYNLAHQYMAAKLNILNGASAPTSVTNAIATSEDLFGDGGSLGPYTPAAIDALKGNTAPRPQFISLAGILGSYNEGTIGPGHCTEDATSAP